MTNVLHRAVLSTPAPAQPLVDIEVGFFNRLEERYQINLEELRQETSIWAEEPEHHHQD